MTWWKHICSSQRSPINNQNLKISLTNGLHFRPNSKVSRFYQLQSILKHWLERLLTWKHDYKLGNIDFGYIPLEISLVTWKHIFNLETLILAWGPGSYIGNNWLMFPSLQLQLIRMLPNWKFCFQWFDSHFSKFILFPSFVSKFTFTFYRLKITGYFQICGKEKSDGL